MFSVLVTEKLYCHELSWCIACVWTVAKVGFSQYNHVAGTEVMIPFFQCPHAQLIQLDLHQQQTKYKKASAL